MIGTMKKDDIDSQFEHERRGQCNKANCMHKLIVLNILNSVKFMEIMFVP